MRFGKTESAEGRLWSPRTLEGRNALTHKDPTFEAVSRREAKSCHPCTWRRRLWGLEFCAKNERKAGDKMKRCDDFRQERNLDESY